MRSCSFSVSWNLNLCTSCFNYKFKFQIWNQISTTGFNKKRIWNSNIPNSNILCWGSNHTAGLGLVAPFPVFKPTEKIAGTNSKNLNWLWKFLNNKVIKLDQEKSILKERLSSIVFTVSPYLDIQHYLLSFRPLSINNQLISCDSLVSKIYGDRK